MNRNFTALALLVILVSTVTGGLRVRSHRRVVSKDQAAAEKFEAERIEIDYSEALAEVEEKYAGEIDYEKATQAAIQGMLFTLDPHSVYFPYAEFKKLKEDQDSRFYGIGVQILRHTDGVYIQSAVERHAGRPAGLDMAIASLKSTAKTLAIGLVTRFPRTSGARGRAGQSEIERAGHSAVTLQIVRDAVRSSSEMLHGPRRYWVHRIDRRLSAHDR